MENVVLQAQGAGEYHGKKKVFAVCMIPGGVATSGSLERELNIYRHGTPVAWGFFLR
ncbi:MAG: hypothetical protein LUQ66_07040 [Methanoregula sp.]|nr:hypothetical protein [Methanoregula sp.]